ncbi:pyridoxal phosphate-dependent aminotransferase [Pyrobaculum aerophilum]|uniref:histidinol-phosphate transaminase n=2 Tax=Pyrobaculum aerophilum TaxID=13773 RepID=Q8ZY38_PYRAE|nr:MULTISPECIES: histidinol-phosphate transaminase [Pyrobaculum]AAL63158.1 histidinol-phosphate aminotransferase (hisC) [Pyrobaculum aerophilum str. IM2]MCX8136128.1 histidinol-phosphate aminotransferase family protein [Pyrobaculum aerophilum]HII48081.1 histidinol-phosphate aminotransferase family protein [Pyrobaculum aerophilum]
MLLPEIDFAYDEPDVGYQKVRLHFNENLFLPEEYYRAVAAPLEPWEVRYYTDPNNKKLAAAIERYLGLPQGSVVITAGADEGLRLAMQLAAHMGRGIVIVEPTYGMARVVARQVGLRPQIATYGGDLSLDVDGILKLGAGAVYLCSPNNPTAHLVKEVEELAAKFNGLVILDSAYAEFAGYWRPRFYEYGNVAEVRTFSKAWGLAGLRVGYVVAYGKLAEALRALSPPHPISSLSAKIVERALEVGRPYVERSVEEVKEVREWVLPQIQAEKFAGPVNFVTLKVQEAEGVAGLLEKRGFVVRVLGGKPLCPACIRFTLAPRPIMERFLQALTAALNNRKQQTKPAGGV